MEKQKTSIKIALSKYAKLFKLIKYTNMDLTYIFFIYKISIELPIYFCKYALIKLKYYELNMF